jgi:hypothetical protein
LAELRQRRLDLLGLGGFASVSAVIGHLGFATRGVLFAIFVLACGLPIAATAPLRGCTRRRDMETSSGPRQRADQVNEGAFRWLCFAARRAAVFGAAATPVDAPTLWAATPKRHSRFRLLELTNAGWRIQRMSLKTRPTAWASPSVGNLKRINTSAHSLTKAPFSVSVGRRPNSS